jgi:hypothetical protein
MNAASIDRDERTITIENASYRWGYLLVTFGLLASTAYRSFVKHESSWDLLGLVVLSGLVTTLFQGRQRALTRRSANFAMVAIVAGVVVAATLVIGGRSYVAASTAYRAANAISDSAPR